MTRRVEITCTDSQSYNYFIKHRLIARNKIFIELNYHAITTQQLRQR